MAEDGMDKIRKKGGRKEYKTGPRALTGPDAMRQRLRKMHITASKKVWTEASDIGSSQWAGLAGVLYQALKALDSMSLW